MLSIGEYIYQEELNTLMNSNIQEGLFDTLKAWGNKFFGWLFKGKKDNSKYTNNKDFINNGLNTVEGFDSTKIKDVQTYYNECFDLNNLSPLSSKNEKNRASNLIKYNKDIFSGVPYKEDLKQGYDLMYVINKDDKYHVLEDSCGIIFYKIDSSVSEANENDLMNDEENKTEEKNKSNSSRLFIKLLYVKNIYFELNKKLAYQITDKILFFIKEGTKNEVNTKDFYIIEIPLNDKNYKNVREYLRGKTKEIETNQDEGILRFKLKY